ncbi:hypothetical protein [Oceanobacillus luteolus]|uniref:Uncharacterized protein n=1 Tax=Oceanobacillus luteolus TaxID=1274358 RepID=A0ABW4HWX2_9BACI
MQRYWNFPATIGGAINSYSNAGLETFRGNPLKSLTREIIQNSLDAAKNPSEPVKIEFSQFKVKAVDFPGRVELVESFQLCERTWRGNNPKTERFIDEGLSMLSNEEINFLRVSDFNTRGLEGADTGKLGSPWSSLVKEAGSSNKQESSGGSFGIGKAAPFLNSQLRTLFYSSYDIKGYESHIGVSNIMSFRKSDNYVATGNGFYTYDEHSPAIPGQLRLDPEFQRNESGTDIFISAFEPRANNWEEEVKNAVLFDFFIPVYRQDLVVKINGYEINHQNVGDLINELEETEDSRILKEYYNLLISDQTIKKEYPAKKYRGGITFREGEATFYLTSGENLNRRVLMTRKTGMRLFEQTHVSGTISFTGILMITGPNMNDIFKEMENPEHNQWSHDRYEEDPNLAKKIYSDLRKFLRDTVKEEFQEEITKETDAYGLSDFLPNTIELSEESKAKQESLGGRVKSIIKKAKEHKPEEKKRRKGKDIKEMEKELVGEFGISPGDLGGNGFGEHQGGGDDGAGLTDSGGNNELDRDKDGTQDKEKVAKPSKHPVRMEQRYMCMDRMKGQYRFNISPKKSLNQGKLVFRVIGEQSDYDVPIVSAETSDPDFTVERIDSNVVVVNTLTKNKRFILDVGIDYPNYCVLEVELYEN